MAVQLKVPVVPVHLEGLYDILSIHDSWPRLGPTVRVRIGPPLYFEPATPYREAARRIEEAVKELSTKPSQT